MKRSGTPVGRGRGTTPRPSAAAKARAEQGRASGDTSSGTHEDPHGSCAPSLYFLDIEASALSPDSFPVEIAWVGSDGVGERHLIRPNDEWLADGCPGWSRESEALHGISFEALIRNGEPIEHVAAHAATVLSSEGNIVCSDAPGYDGPWLQMSFEYGGQRVTLDLFDVREVYGKACRPLPAPLAGLEGREREHAMERIRRMANELIGLAEVPEERRPRIRHRELADADGPWRTWQAVVKAVAERLAEERAP